MIRAIVLVFFLVIYCNAVVAQDTLAIYDFYSKQLEFIPPVEYDVSKRADQTSFSVGDLKNKELLSLEPPTANLYPKTQFSQVKPASTFFDVTTYPTRTAIKIFGYQKGQLVQLGSGIMVSENLVLTAGHLFKDMVLCDRNSWNCDSLLVAPGFDGGKFQEKLPKSLVKKIYLFKSFYDKCLDANEDIALLELKETIGKRIGYVGIAFNNDTSYFKHKVFHKLSYPGVTDFIAKPPRTYTGDTLFYNYGFIDNFLQGLGGSEYLGVTDGWGIPGQSGSSLFYTDNESYYTYGIATWSHDMKHYKITAQTFYQIQHVINNLAKVPAALTGKPALYPNPFHTEATLEFDNSENLSCTFKLFDSEGRLVQNQKDITGSKLKIYKHNLKAGLYYYKLYSQSKVFASGKVMIH